MEKESSQPTEGPLPQTAPSPVLTIVIVLGVILLLAVGYFILRPQANKPAQTNLVPPPPVSAPSPAATSTAINYRPPVAGETQINISVSNSPVYVNCPTEQASLVQKAVDKTKETLTTLNSCNSEKCVKDFESANDNLLSLIKKYCKS